MFIHDHITIIHHITYITQHTTTTHTAIITLHTPALHINRAPITHRRCSTHHTNHIHSQFLQIVQFLQCRCKCTKLYSSPQTIITTTRSTCKGCHMHIIHHNIRQFRIRKGIRFRQGSLEGNKRVVIGLAVTPATNR